MKMLKHCVFMLKSVQLSFLSKEKKTVIEMGEDFLHDKAFSISSAVLVTTPELKEKRIPNIPFFLLPGGEKAKSRKSKDMLEDWLIAHKYGRDTTLIALGGGALLDVVGFVAATFCRGVSFISIPTTLLAMTDAALGGKVGINLGLAKNYLGAFYPAEKIYIDLSFLKTLPFQEIKNGMMEIIKHSLIGSASLFGDIEARWDELIRGDSMFSILEQSIEIKKNIVEKDPYDETGIREQVNFGHTLGHAFEAASLHTLPHGEAVRLGMIGESYLALKMKILEETDFTRIFRLLTKHSYSVPPLSCERVQEFLVFDKKRRGGKPRFIILEKIGKPKRFSESYATYVPENLIKEAILFTLCHIEKANERENSACESYC